MTTPQTPSAPQPATLPVVRLLPKANARAIRHGFPWVYANELVTDRRTRGLAPGTLALLEDADRKPMGLRSIGRWAAPGACPSSLGGWGFVPWGAAYISICNHE